MKKLQYCVYVLQSLKDKKLYIGSTSNLNQRLTHHIKGHSLATKSRRPLTLIFCEYFLAKKDCLRREKYFKTSPGKRALKIILKESFQKMACVNNLR
ncbi:GIY-YIG nuclease family protein [Patescibacteria group bacterium]|nr:GIY-YIG nuclease family protein [Patescibacteria group bacterium]